MKYTTPKRLILIIIITLVILPVSLSFYLRAINGIDYGIGKYTQYRRDQIGLKLIAEAEKRYREDTYGGKTPEDAMNLFIEALKKGDIELASRYFFLDKQKEKEDRLIVYKKRNVLGSLIFDLQYNLKITKPIYEDSFRYVLYDKKNRETGILDIKKNINGVWKLDGIF